MKLISIVNNQQLFLYMIVSYATWIHEKVSSFVDNSFIRKITLQNADGVWAIIAHKSVIIFVGCEPDDVSRWSLACVQNFTSRSVQ